MKKIINSSILFLAFFLLFPSQIIYADFVNGASVSNDDIPFPQVQESLVLNKSQNQYFFDPAKTSLALNDDFTLEAWIKVNQFYPGGSWIITKDNGTSDRQFALAAADIHKIAFQIRGVGNLNSQNLSLTTNTWTHIAAVWHSNTKTVDFYINGQFDSSATTGENIPSSGDNAEFEIGNRENGNNGNIFDGKIAEVRIWNVARTNFQISDNYNDALVGNETGLVAYYNKWTTNNPSLNVPLLKQTDLQWKAQIYDKANIWNPSDPTINAWGCAMTSATMILRYHGINLLPDGTSLNPGTLNTWLNNQVDGYVDNGLVNWLAITRLSKLAKINNTTSFDALEYSRISGTNITQLTEDLGNNIPGILEEPGHFVVAKGITSDSFAINDPFFDDRTTLASYSGTFLSLNRFVPSNTNLAYIMVVLESHIQAVLKDPGGNVVGQNFIQNPITNPLQPSQNNGPAKRIIYLEKPIEEQYILTLSTTPSSTYSAAIYLYDKDGNVIKKSAEGILGATDTDTVTIQFNENGNNPSYIERKVTFQSTIADIAALRSINHIKKEKLKTDLTKLMQKAEGIVTAKKFKKNELKQKFNDFKEDIKNNRKKDMSEQAYQILLYDLEFLRKLYL